MIPTYNIVEKIPTGTVVTHRYMEYSYYQRRWDKHCFITSVINQSKLLEGLKQCSIDSLAFYFMYFLIKLLPLCLKGLSSETEGGYKSDINR